MISGKLTTHVLDTARGCPASGMVIELYDLESDASTPIATVVTNTDGRCDAPLLSDGQLDIGRYELRFFAADYFETQQVALENGQFLDVIPIQFVVADKDAHYHVPLLVSPYGFSTYRGS